jgi:hypothetical protein
MEVHWVIDGLADQGRRPCLSAVSPIGDKMVRRGERSHVPNCDIRSFDVVDCPLVDGVSKTQMSPTAQRLCDALNCLWTIRIGRGQFGELLEIRQCALQIVLPFP